MMVWLCTAIPSGLGDIEDGAGYLNVGLRRCRVARSVVVHEHSAIAKQLM
jgi:hypothetical protein